MVGYILNQTIYISINIYLNIPVILEIWLFQWNNFMYSMLVDQSVEREIEVTVNIS
jgi:hypothetical protein